MTFARPWLLSLLAVLPVILFLMIVEARVKMRALLRFARDGLLQRLTGKPSAGRSFL